MTITKKTNLLAPTRPWLTDVASTNANEPIRGKVFKDETVLLYGKNFDWQPDDEVTISDGTTTWTFHDDGIAGPSSETIGVLPNMATVGGVRTPFAPTIDCAITVSYKGRSVSAEYKLAR